MEWFLIVLVLATSAVLINSSPPTAPEVSRWGYMPSWALTLLLMGACVVLFAEYLR